MAVWVRETFLHFYTKFLYLKEIKLYSTSQPSITGEQQRCRWTNYMNTIAFHNYSDFALLQGHMESRCGPMSSYVMLFGIRSLYCARMTLPSNSALLCSSAWLLRRSRVSSRVSSLDWTSVLNSLLEIRNALAIRLKHAICLFFWYRDI